MLRLGQSSAAPKARTRIWANRLVAPWGATHNLSVGQCNAVAMGMSGQGQQRVKGRKKRENKAEGPEKDRKNKGRPKGPQLLLGIPQLLPWAARGGRKAWKGGEEHVRS